GAAPADVVRPRGRERRPAPGGGRGACYDRAVPNRGEGRIMIEPKIDDLLGAEGMDSKYSLVILAAKRAREINSYYSQLGEGRGEFVPPLVETGGLKNKPLSTALQEIAEGTINAERPEGVGIK